MFCILHITDLHRAKGDPISNAELISALVSDRDRYIHEDPPIALPQAVIVSGDVIQGVTLGHPDPDKELADQYDSANDFLAELADRFLAGDRSKIIIVPGNHDIDWNRAFAAMEKVGAGHMPNSLPGALYEPGSPYRWNWKERELYVVKDEAAYVQRFAAFWNFFERFYEGVPNLLRVSPWSDANLFSLDDGRIGVAAFNSCARNDCFAFEGEIPRDVIARSHLDLKQLGPWQLRIAVWHHDIEGPPHRSDYMDPDIVRGMIGRGFRLGLYGHQHRTQITPQHAYLPDKETMAIASAGSLCAGARELPTGARRGYSIIEIADDYCKARVHVREMAFANLFSRANLASFGGLSFADLEWTKPVDAGGRPEDATREKRVSVLREAERALMEMHDPVEALRLLSVFDISTDAFARRLTIQAAETIPDWDKIIAAISEPQSIEELVLATVSYIRRGDPDAASTLLSKHAPRLELPDTIKDDLMNQVNLKKRVMS